MHGELGRPNSHHKSELAKDLRATTFRRAHAVNKAAGSDELSQLNHRISALRDNLAISLSRPRPTPARRTRRALLTA